ncbi:acyl-CoA dehydrogenase family protein [Roseixanthobacter glucoisosaccharinicivorans]|uniref:acyl-CoA dehydrogenase family protein n=1 Tax=Roseixanthobacter glucoisosaccharinicivorans TaxID=3119923 RepID=UPI003728E4D6
MRAWDIWDLPFFAPSHRDLASRLKEWQAQSQDEGEGGSPYFARECRSFAREMAEWGFLDYVVPAPGRAASQRLDVRAICLIREALAYKSALVDSVFIIQGLATAPLWQAGTERQRQDYLDPCRRGERIPAFALTEPDAGSDVAAVATTATADGDHYVLNGAKTWITNAGAADFYVVVARTGEAPGARGLSMFIVDADVPGLTVTSPLRLVADHPIAGLQIEDCRVPKTNMIGSAGAGFKAAMATFDVFRPSVGAAAVGMARRALAETLERVEARRMFGHRMAELETIQSRIADMVLDLESAALLVYRAAWAKDTREGRLSRESALAKLGATEAAQRVIDSAVQLFGGLGVARGSVVERLYRDIRPMRIYEGASEVQKLVIARNTMSTKAAKSV